MHRMSKNGLTVLLLGGVVLSASRPTIAQTPWETALPRDSSVTVGTFANGLRYYIRANDRPRNRAEIRLVVNAGSILEDESQLGLAHFAEHMAFNGTRRFPKQELIDYLERVGMRFGADLNASTSFDQTVYMFTIPTDSADVVRTAFDILEDWAHAVTFDSTEIEKERGVVLEEWRLGRGADARVLDKQLPIVFRGSRYADRLPIGTTEVLRTFEHEDLRRFYTDWYRPDLMAIVAVGDFDVDVVEELIRERFADLPAPTSPRPRLEYDVPGHREVLSAIETDPELTSTTVAVYHKTEPAPLGTVGAFRRSIVERLYNSMLNDRLFAIQEQPNAPFLFATAGQTRFVRPLEVFFLLAGVRDGEGARGLEALLTETTRVARHGFTETELERHKREALRYMERAYAERDKTDSRIYAGEYVRHFIEAEPFPGIAYELKLYEEVLPGITLDEVNDLAGSVLTRENRVVVLSAPELADRPAPSDAELLGVFSEVEGQAIEAYVDSLSDVPLLDHVPTPGRVVEEQYAESIDVHDWTLSNGVRVILKPTDFRDDQILLRAISPGGSSLVPDSLYVAAMTASSVVASSGVGPFSVVDLEKVLAGKVVDVQPEIDGIGEGLIGGASPRDVETMFKLIYLTFTAPRRDTAAYLSFQQRMQEFVRNRDASPDVAFQDTITAVLSQNHYRMRPFTSALFDEMDLDQSLSFYRDRFADASDFTFVIVGTFTPDSLRPLIESYLGSLPATDRTESWRDVGIRPPTGVIRKVVRRGLEPQSKTRVIFTGVFPFSRSRQYLLGTMAYILDLRLRDRLREELGGTYGASVWADAQRIPDEQYYVSVDFGSDPERVDEMVSAVFEEIDRLKQDGPTADELVKVREAQRRSRETSLRENSYWQGQLLSRARFDEPLTDLLAFDTLLDSLTSAGVREMANEVLRRDNYILATLVPERQN